MRTASTTILSSDPRYIVYLCGRDVVQVLHGRLSLYCWERGACSRTRGPANSPPHASISSHSQWFIVKFAPAGEWCRSAVRALFLITAACARSESSAVGHEWYQRVGGNMMMWDDHVSHLFPHAASLLPFHTSLNSSIFLNSKVGHDSHQIKAH